MNEHLQIFEFEFLMEIVLEFLRTYFFFGIYSVNFIYEIIFDNLFKNLVFIKILFKRTV